MKDPAVDILGAGLCGSLLSIMLARRNLAVTLWERQADPRIQKRLQGRSINLALSARGIRALRHVGVFDDVQALLMPMRGRMIHHPDGSTELQPYGQREHEQIYSVSRADLNCLLLDKAQQDFGLDVRFEYIAETFDVDTATLHLTNRRDGDARLLTAAPLIAADGAGSVIRRTYNGSSRIAPCEQLLPHGYKELNLPAAADGSFQLQPDALHIWPRGGFMLIALPNPGGDFTLTLFLPNDGEPSFKSLDNAGAIQAFCEQNFADIVSLLPSLQTEFAGNPVGLLGTVRCQHWHDAGRVLLIGDAAHAIVPFHGQGMNLAFEDCVVLDRLLETGNQWHDVFRRFEFLQLANAEAIADMALENYVEMRDRVRDPGFVLQQSLAFELERRLPGRFIPRYSMVMFHDEIPYAVARERGALQENLLRQITAGAESLPDIDLNAAEALVRATLPPL
jgi:kynurenine 3-monooxygenase